jgi:hypothetical protein
MSYIEQIDVEPVNKIIESYNFNESVEKDLRELINFTVREYLNLDLKTFKITGVEKEYLIPISGIKYKGIVDLELEVIDPKNRYKFPVGAKVKIDWKTTGLALLQDYAAKKFKDLYRETFQWRLYSYIEPRCDYFMFRGVSKADGGFVQMIQQPYPLMGQDVEAFMVQARSSIDSQKGKALPWLKNVKSCNAYGTPCAYAANDTCLRGTPEEFLIDPELPEHLSFSSIDAFLTCPERYRRDRLVMDDLVTNDASDASTYGKAFHECIAAIYKQFQEN